MHGTQNALPYIPSDKLQPSSSPLNADFTNDEGGTEISWNEEDSLACGVESSLTLNRDELILVEEDISDVRIDNDSSQVTNTIFNKHVDQYSSTGKIRSLNRNYGVYTFYHNTLINIMTWYD